MDSEDWNKVFGAVTGTALFVVAVTIISEGIYSAEAPKQPAYSVPVAETKAEAPAAGAPAAATAAQAALPDFATAIPAADVMAGADVAERCAPCHDWSKGGPNKIGPNLFGVVGGAKGSHPGFEYSAAIKEKGGNWTYADLFNFLRQPASFAPGTKMGFAGLPREADRINLIAFLRMQADSPAPLR